MPRLPPPLAPQALRSLSPSQGMGGATQNPFLCRQTVELHELGMKQCEARRAASPGGGEGGESAQRAEAARLNGLDAYKAGDLKRACAMFSEAIKNEPGNSIHWSNRCQVHLALRCFVAAGKDADAALALDSSCAKAWYRKGRALEGLGRSSSALTCLERALELLEPTLPVGHKMYTQVSAAIREVRQHLRKHGAFTPGSCTWRAQRPACSSSPCAAGHVSASCTPGQSAEAATVMGSAHASWDTSEAGATTRRVTIRLKFEKRAVLRLEVVVPHETDSARGKCETCVHFFREIAGALQLHLDTMTLICKGSKLTAQNLHALENHALVLVIGQLNSAV